MRYSNKKYFKGSIIDFLVILIFGLIIFIAILSIKKIGLKRRTTLIKKSEIISSYEKQLNRLTTKEEKLSHLKTINQELSRNIFFDQSEIQDAIKHLSKTIV